MSKLERLIEELCPDGVEYKKLEQIITFQNGKGHEKDVNDTGEFIIVNAKFISTDGKVKKYCSRQICPVFKEDILMVMSDLPNGKALAKCFIVGINDKYSLNQRIGRLTVKEKEIINYKFLYYILNRNKQLLRHDNKVDQTNLKKSDILNILIPVPPLPVQEEIVRILDSFTELKAELEEELEARKKQYEWYRDWLLKPNPTDNIMKLGDCCTIKARIGWQGLTKKEYLDEGDYYLITGTDFKNGQVDFEHCHYVKQERYDQDTNIQIRNSDVLVTKDGTLGKVAFVDNLDKPATLNSGVFVVRGNNSLLDQRYLYHFLKSNYLMSFAKSRITGGTIKHLNQNIMVEVPIFVPTLEKQRKLANILDSFDNICFSFSQGLPAEIDSRQKQYEYYRDKLLTFKRLEKDDREGIEDERV